MSTAAFTLRETAREDLEGIEEDLATRASPDIAAEFLAAATAAFRLLATQPEMGRRWESPDPRLAGVRVWQLRLHYGYVIFYRPVETERAIDVLHIFHGAHLPRCPRHPRAAR